MQKTKPQTVMAVAPMPGLSKRALALLSVPMKRTGVYLEGSNPARIPVIPQAHKGR